MKRTDLVFAGLLIPLDYLALLVAAWAAYTIRFDRVTGVLPVVSSIPFGDFFRTVALVAAGWIAVLAMAGVYRLRSNNLLTEMGRIFLGSSTAVLLIIVFIFFQREFYTSRFIIVGGWILAVLAVWIVHLIVRAIQRVLASHGVGVRQVVVIGADQATIEMLATIHANGSLGLRIVKHFATITPEHVLELEAMLQQRLVDDVVQTDPTIPRAQTMLMIDACHEYNVPFAYAADTFDSQARVEPDQFASLPVMALKRTPLDGWGRILKRSVDVIGSVIGIIIFAIPGAIVAILIKLDSDGPVFLEQDRVGEGQRKFRIWKFRSMIKDAHALRPQLAEQNERGGGPLFKIANDPRITRVGRWIRKTSIDELPQLFNVFLGDMSLVGPRPHLPEEVARYEKPHKKLLVIKPGVTGMAQISGRSNLSFEDEVRLDTYYIEHWSLGLDLQILLRTPGAIVNAKDAV